MSFVRVLYGLVGWFKDIQTAREPIVKESSINCLGSTSLRVQGFEFMNQGIWVALLRALGLSAPGPFISSAQTFR